MTLVGDEERLLARLAADRVGHRHRFGGRRPLVEQRRVRDLQTGEIDHHRLEGQQRLEPSLRDLGLIRRVGRVPAGILEHVALDDRRRDAVVSSRARGTTARSGCAARSRAGGRAPRARTSARGSRADGSAGCAPAPSRRSARRASRSPSRSSIARIVGVVTDRCVAGRSSSRPRRAAVISRAWVVMQVLDRGREEAR